MEIIDKYLMKLHKESAYANPLQTRPKPTGGITKQMSDEEEYPVGVKGPSGAEVDLDQDDEDHFNKPFTYKYKLEG